ncbi:importin subunit alpha [Anaeramoeba flamelloides]|uniref:Importin subunit alpha n=1 Tax=Anaeramoeba flamelloides TaxID=1746091 RepID=A0AAV7Y4V8_9EUKA|nr:importin subunit alpha [Anaeramoeba flamelloides]KAJ6234623.1 importin subunit alpha [Anaeramoeba flamelloides]
MSNFERKLQKRKKKYLRTSDRESSVIRRESLAYSISKNKREKNLLKKRMLPQPTSTIKISANFTEWEKIPLPKPVELFKYKRIFQKGTKMEIYKHLFLIRKLVSKGTKNSYNMVIASGIIEELTEYLSEFDDPYLQIETVRILGHMAESNQASNRIFYEYELIPKYIKLLNTKRTEIFEHAIWTLSSMANFKDQYRENILDQKGSFELIFRALKLDDFEFQMPSLRCLGNIICLSRNEIDLVIEEGAIQILVELFQNGIQLIEEEICWILSNICLISADHIQMLFDQKILPLIYDKIENCGFVTKKNLISILSNICIKGNDIQMNQLLKYDILKLLCKNLDVDDIELSITCLNGIKALLIYGEFYDESTQPQKSNAISQHIRSFGGDEIILKTCYHTAKQVTQLARVIYETYLQNNNNNEVDIEND